MKKILAFMAALVMAAASMSAQDLVIVHFNDTHSHLEPIRASEPGKGTGIEAKCPRVAYGVNRI